MERKLASIRRIDNITPVEGADAIECAHIGGWKVVVKKGEYSVDSLAIYLEIDSWVPTAIAPFLTKAGKEPSEYNSVKGERLRTVKLRGQISQGLLLPMSALFSKVVDICGKPMGGFMSEGEDVTDVLGIQKWEPPETKVRSADANGNFPTFIPKTDQERVQNLKREVAEATGDSFEVTIKRDGSSMTVYVNQDNEGVCSRNLDLKDGENTFWDAARKYSLHEKIRSTGRNLALQGELLSLGIQGNYEKVSGVEWWCFDIFDIDSQEYLLPKDRRELCAKHNIPHIAVLDEDFVLDHPVEELLAMAEGDGVNSGVKREGLVFKSNMNNFSFKAISNSYLLKKG